MSTKKYRDADNSFGKRLRNYRKAKGIKGVEFAKYMGISQASLSAIENDKASTSVQAITNLVQNTDINIYWLLTGEGVPYIENETEIMIKPDDIEMDHMSLMKNFKDKPRAKIASVGLLRIEELDRETFIEVVGYIRGVANSLKVKEQVVGSTSGGTTAGSARKGRANG